MNLRTIILEWLGITQLTQKVNKINSDVDDLDKDIRRLRADQIVQSNGIARIIAKVDPYYGTQGDELSPVRKAESDRISEAAMRRLRAESSARAPYNQGI